jgi:hypothetical protein
MREETMTLKDIREIAKHYDIKAAKMKKDELIKAVQRAEGNFDCFGSAISGYCSQDDCLWKSDCTGKTQV